MHLKIDHLQQNSARLVLRAPRCNLRTPASD